ncbi:6970_t:CDS:1, partial [Racocetra fulgida]
MATNLELPKNIENQLEYLEIISKRPRTFFIQEALKNYLEDLEALRIVLEREGQRGETYTTEELKKKLNL